jgi:DNA-binding NtrC family response regulator
MSFTGDKMAKILLIDDEDGPREKYRALFEQAGHEVITAIYAGEALQKFEEKKPGIVVTGVCMIDSNPIIGVRELVSRMKKSSPEASIIILTVHKTWENCFLEEQIAGFVGKFPEDEGLLMETIEQCQKLVLPEIN